MLPSQRLANASRSRLGLGAAGSRASAASTSRLQLNCPRHSGTAAASVHPSAPNKDHHARYLHSIAPFVSQSIHSQLASRRSFSATAQSSLPRSKSKGLSDEQEEEDGGVVGREEEESDLHARQSKSIKTQDDSSSSGSSSGGESSSSSSGSSSNGSSAGGGGSGSGSGSGKGSGGDGNSSGGGSLSRQTVPTVYPQVLALPITRRPLFPGFYKAVVIKDPNVCAAIREAQHRGQPYVGAFLLKDENDDADVITDLDKVHKTGVFAQITNTFPVPSSGGKGEKGEAGKAEEGEEGLTAVLYPHRRIHIDELIHPNGQGIGAQGLSQPPPPPQDVPSAIPGNETESGKGESAEAAVAKRRGELKEEEGKVEYIPGQGVPFQTSFLHDFKVSLVNVSNLSPAEYEKDSNVIRAVKAELISVFKDIAQLNPMFRDQIANFSISQGAGNVFDEPDKLADFAAAVSSGEVGELQAVLEELNIEDRLQKALLVLKKELMNAQLQSKISKDVEAKIQKRQREYYLMEQLKGIKKELGLESDGKDRMVEKFKEKVAQLNMPEAARKVFDEELSKLQTLEPAASEFNVTRGYLDWLTSIPWGVHSPENYSIANATRVLNDDHYGLKDVKDRILEFLAVGKLRGTVEGKIICLVGPPGVGKTSIGKSIARAVERQFFRFSVGGLSDVAEIKGHRRTYVGAMPGKAIQALKKVGTENPLVLIDEVDKIGRGHNGDPSSALLEMLDPEQNSGFLDHYLDVPVDLSRVLFVCTANTLDTIPQPLLDRMEVIEVSSYTADEKRHIAKGYLAPQAKDASGLKEANVNLPDDTIEFLIRHHARESGVRNLRKLLEKVYRKIAYNIVRDHGETVFPEPKEGDLQPATAASAAPTTDDASGASPAEPAGSAESSSQSVTPPPGPSDSAAPDNLPKPDESSSEKKEDNEVSSKPITSDTQARDAPPEPPSKTTTQKREPMKVPDSVQVEITIDSLREYLGPPVYHKDRLYTKTMPAGVSTGLGYLGNGSGSVMPIETSIMPGKGGAIKLTGKLGDVIKESANIALSWLKSNAYSLGITEDQKTNALEDREVHLHMPEGSIGKEGPSAGVAFITSLVSLLTNRSMPTDLAMTGEVSLRGIVLPVGGLKEKLLAAHRSGIKKVILPAQNQPNVEADVPRVVLDDLDVNYVSNVWSALHIAFGEGPWSARAKELQQQEQEELKEEEGRRHSAQKKDVESSDG
ncbi:ATP-dependent protease La [Ceraceosorus guamensis]|uniref:Lon protease homolog, mitochondrial n=1 Tax=Ceraceosorus guamensis TaxID=1522189 RepID=A0A316VWM4_9BASI|nr:ATP-dependent protease La [Ceraceosorus guamensis]PWN41348.1 ATP-dependent protease La [Ceraceosorus guamensis]